jgi:hypothetical protein
MKTAEIIAELRARAKAMSYMRGDYVTIRRSILFAAADRLEELGRRVRDPREKARAAWKDWTEDDVKTELKGLSREERTEPAPPWRCHRCGSTRHSCCEAIPSTATCLDCGWYEGLPSTRSRRTR